jgi:hypothetical protein
MDSDSLVDSCLCVLFMPFLLYRAAARALYGTLLCECSAMHSDLGCSPWQPSGYSCTSARAAVQAARFCCGVASTTRWSPSSAPTWTLIQLSTLRLRHLSRPTRLRALSQRLRHDTRARRFHGPRRRPLVSTAVDFLVHWASSIGHTGTGHGQTSAIRDLPHTLRLAHILPDAG